MKGVGGTIVTNTALSFNLKDNVQCQNMQKVYMQYLYFFVFLYFTMICGGNNCKVMREASRP